MNIPEQYDAYICGNQAIHPPAIYLAPRFATRGDAAIPLLRSKLQATKENLTIRDIILVLRYMQAGGTYDVRSDTSLMRLVEQSAARITDEAWKPVVQENVQAIKQMPR